jgi:thiamine biosynthesis lipoprotein
VSDEAHLSFACFGGTASVHVRGEDRAGGEQTVRDARDCMLDAHERLSRFSEDSELSRLNRDPRREVPASPLMRRLAIAVRAAAERSRGLVDATLLGEIERAGYRTSMAGREEPLDRHPPAPEPVLGAARPHPARRWREIRVDEAAGTIARPTGLRIDSGGLAKGMVADLIADRVQGRRAFAVDCCGDVRIGGTAGQKRVVRVADPFGGEPVHELALSVGALATTGITRRQWVGDDGKQAHHLLDPRSGRPAFTGVTQVTAIAPLGVLAETYAKAALLSGPAGAAAWLPHGGVIVLDDGEVELVGAARALAEPEPAL